MARWRKRLCSSSSTEFQYKLGFRRASECKIRSQNSSFVLEFPTAPSLVISRAPLLLLLLLLLLLRRQEIGAVVAGGGGCEPRDTHARHRLCSAGLRELFDREAESV